MGTDENQLVRDARAGTSRFAPDAHFTQEQYDRMKELVGRAGTLTPKENEELDVLIDAELDATVTRTDAWWKRHLGAFKDSPLFDEAMRLGAEYRRQQPTPADDPDRNES